MSTSTREISEDHFRVWRICWRVSSAFTSEFDNQRATSCMKCDAIIPPDTLKYRPMFIPRVVVSSCSHTRSGSLCSRCDADMLFKISRGEEKCFTKGCNEYLQVDVQKIAKALAGFPALLKECASSEFKKVPKTYVSSRYIIVLGFECIICGDFKRYSQARPVTADCAHTVNVCRDDMTTMIEVDVNCGKLNISCPDPSCRAKMKLGDVKAFASDKIFQRYGDMQLQRTLMDMPEYMACKRGQDLCSWGQLHPPKDSHPRMVCDKCRFTSCFTCKVPWHENQTCAQYQFLQMDGESKEYIKRYCKKCPRSGCGAPTKKNKACHEMSCENISCKTLWCWECKAILDNSTPYHQRHGSQHLSSCTAEGVRASRSLSGFHSISNPTSSDGRYRTGWAQDVGFVGTGEEY